MLYWKPKNYFDLNLVYFLKWLLAGSLIGLLSGVIGAAFAHMISFAAKLNLHCFPYLMILMPIAGCIIVWLYSYFHELANSGTNMVIEAVHSNENMRKINGPLIFVSTILSHLAGASVGKEGAALQIGGSLGSGIGELLHLDESDKKIIIMSGMSGMFGAVFGTPAGAAVFPVEMISVGVMYYTALLPCLAASIVGAYTAAALGVLPEHFLIHGMETALSYRNIFPLLFLGIGCALVSILFCRVLKMSAKLYQKYTSSPYQKVLLGSVLFWALVFLFGSDYTGSGTILIEKAIEGNVDYSSFLLKMIFTAVALGAGFKGGEIVPTLTIGASFGAAFGSILGLDPSFGASLGMVGVFAGVTNCPMATTLLAAEMFGGQGLLCYVLVIILAYALSGYSSLYAAQRFMYAKTKARYINRYKQQNEVDIIEKDEETDTLHYI